jgi:hypothetical protein
LDARALNHEESLASVIVVIQLFINHSPNDLLVYVGIDLDYQIPGQTTAQKIFFGATPRVTTRDDDEKEE